MGPPSHARDVMATRSVALVRFVSSTSRVSSHALPAGSIANAANAPSPPPVHDSAPDVHVAPTRTCTSRTTPSAPSVASWPPSGPKLEPVMVTTRMAAATSGAAPNTADASAHCAAVVGRETSRNASAGSAYDTMSTPAQGLYAEPQLSDAVSGGGAVTNAAALGSGSPVRYDVRRTARAAPTPLGSGNVTVSGVGSPRAL